MAADFPTDPQRLPQTRPVRSLPVWTFAVAALVLGFCARAGVGFRDSGELGAAGYTLGVAHPTGFPLDMLLLRAAALLPVGSIALRQNLAVALLGAACLGLSAYVTMRLAERAGLAGAPARTGGVLGALGLGTFATFAAAAVQVEVYATALALVLGAAALALGPPARRGMLYPLAGVALGSHVTAAGFVALMLAGVVAADPALRHKRALAVGAASLAACALVLAYLPLASLRDPPLDWGSPRTLGALLEHLSAARIRHAYAPQMFSATPAVQWFEQVAELWPLFVPAVLGIRLGWLRDRTVLLSFAGALTLDMLYATRINPMGIADRQVGHVVGAVLACWSGLGGAWLHEVARRPLARAAALGALGALAAVMVARAEVPGAAAPHAAAELWGSGGPLARVPPRARVLCSSDDACAVGLFAQHVEAVRPDVLLVPAQHLWEAQWRRRLGLTPARVGAGERLAAARAAVARLARDETRAVLWESDEPLRDAGYEGPLGLAEPLPYLQPGIAWRPGALEAVDRMRRARGGYALAESARARHAWSLAYARIGRAALAQDRVQEAVRAFERAVTLDGGRSVPWTNLGVALQRSGELRAAIAATERARALAPRRPTPWVNLARYQQLAGDLEAARRTVREAERRGIRDPRLGQLGANVR